MSAALLPSSPPAARHPAAWSWFPLVPVLTFGLGTAAIFVWAARRQGLPALAPGRPAPGVPPRPVLLLLALLTGLLTLLAMRGGFTGMLLLALAGFAVGLRLRDRVFPAVVSELLAELNRDTVSPVSPLSPVVTQALARRALREQYRELVAQDAPLAREIGVGLVHLDRGFDDGGLVDVNGVPEQVLVDRCALSPEQARQVVEVRSRRRGLQSFDELVVYTDLPHETLQRLRETAVFVPL